MSNLAPTLPQWLWLAQPSLRAALGPMDNKELFWNRLVPGVCCVWGPDTFSPALGKGGGGGRVSAAPGLMVGEVPDLGCPHNLSLGGERPCSHKGYLSKGWRVGSRGPGVGAQAWVAVAKSSPMEKLCLTPTLGRVQKVEGEGS